MFNAVRVQNEKELWGKGFTLSPEVVLVHLTRYCVGFFFLLDKEEKQEGKVAQFFFSFCHYRNKMFFVWVAAKETYSW